MVNKLINKLHNKSLLNLLSNTTLVVKNYMILVLTLLNQKRTQNRFDYKINILNTKVFKETALFQHILYLYIIMALSLVKPDYLDKIETIDYVAIPKNKFDNLKSNPNINEFIDEYYWHPVTINGSEYYVKNGKKYRTQMGYSILLPDNPLPSDFKNHITHIGELTPLPVNYASFSNLDLPNTPDSPSPTCFKGECVMSGGKIKRRRKSKGRKTKRRKTRRK